MQVLKEEGHWPVKAWVDGVELEEAAKKQLLNVAKLPFIHRHVAVMPDVHWGMGATVGSVIPTVGAIVPAAVGVDIGCFVGETKIPLLDGTQKTLLDLLKMDKPFWVYSMNKDLKITPGKARCLKTQSNASLIRVTISGGDEIICTPDHQFMRSDGSYVAAEKLRLNESLMPLYRKWLKNYGYERVYSTHSQVEYTHTLIYKSAKGPIKKGHHVHHKNHKEYDNTPSNLKMLTGKEHSAHHRKHGHTFNNADPAFQEARKAGIARRVNDPTARAKMVVVGTKNIKTYMRKHRAKYLKSIKNNGKHGAKVLRKFNTSPRLCDVCGLTCKNPATLTWHKRKKHAYNHVVISIEKLGYTADVYCLQVEKHHNFALSAGVFVHNCGMVAVKTSIIASQLPDSLSELRSTIEAMVPHGRTTGLDRGAWENQPASVERAWYDPMRNLCGRLNLICDKYPKINPKTYPVKHLGTLGTGNHFVEVCLDEHQAVWIMLHSGSRGIGNKIGSYFIEQAKLDMEKWHIAKYLPDQDLAYLPEHTVLFDDYIEAVGWAQEFAMVNRELMLIAVFQALRSIFPDIVTSEKAINCHHNYVERENHFGKNVLVTRKGAVRARVGELGIIPGSMGAKSFIVRGKGNKESFCSCSHGAGRRMSRTVAKQQFSLEDHAKATVGVECRKDAEVLDETPGAYKSIDAVMAAQADLVDIVHTLKQVLCVKG